MKNVTKILLAFAAVIFLFTACGKAEEEPIDVSDVKDMVFGSEVPFMLYCSEEKIIIDGAGFGVVVYDLENGRLTDRITYDEIRELGMTGYFNFASADGKTIYFTDMQQSVGLVSAVAAYDVESKNFSPVKEMSDDEFREESWNWDGGRFQAGPCDPYNSFSKDYEKYHEYFEKYFDQNCLIGANTVTLENEFVFLIIPSGMLYDTQIVICGNNGGEKVYRVFDDAD
ncbi:MAG: hypothetical protein K2N71_05845 [Oscillospiraceae bacterium]|nr:hypothetical protein [Oscillospiraceae bacterium]